MTSFADILKKEFLEKEDIICLLKAEGEEEELLFKRAKEIRDTQLGNKVYLRGLLEYSNICVKDCFYCGIRKSNKKQIRYTVSKEDVLKSAKYALDNNYGSIVIQAGERTDKVFINQITAIVSEIKFLSNGTLGITLSLGEQSLDTYKQWFNAGAHRYLLRIETSNKELYYKIHPQNKLHNFENRIKALHHIREAGFQLGTGVMIGLPFQTIEDLADDLIFLRDMDVDMVGMGPFIEHSDTPLFRFKNKLVSKKERIELSFKMIAVLRIMMQDINIAAATALQAIDPMGRERAINFGANILMPNITPGNFRDNYKLYEDKPCTDENPNDCKSCIDIRLGMIGANVGYNEWGDSKHFLKSKLIEQS